MCEKIPHTLALNRLKVLLDTLYESRSPQHLENDPLSRCHRYEDRDDREIAALIASSFAYGSVKIILRSLDEIFRVMGPSPRRFVERFDPGEGLRQFSGFKHRFNDERDLCALILAARMMLETAGSIETFFLGGHFPDDQDITRSLARFSAAVLNLDYEPVFGERAIPRSSYFPFFFPAPDSGSACKRLCMFLRWVVRRDDGIDLGLWNSIPPHLLVIPVDLHIRRIARLLGLTARNQADWKMAREITVNLRQIDPLDPIKYDFSLCHLGISEGCNGKSHGICTTCLMAPACTTAAGQVRG